jgi:hypothetical protein
MKDVKRKGLTLKSKKGNAVLDTVLFLVVIFGFAVISIIGFVVFDDINTDLQNEADLSATTKSSVDDLNTRYPSFMDAGFILLLVLLWALVVVASFNIDSHPIFFIFSVILLGFLLWIGAEVSNVFIDITNDSDYSDAVSSFPMTSFVMSNLVVFLIAIGASALLALYGKSRLEI